MSTFSFAVFVPPALKGFVLLSTLAVVLAAGAVLIKKIVLIPTTRWDLSGFRPMFYR